MTDLAALAEKQRNAMAAIEAQILAFEAAVAALADANKAARGALNNQRAAAGSLGEYPMAVFASLAPRIGSRLSHAVTKMHSEDRRADMLKLAAGSARPTAGRKQTVGMRRA